MIEPIMEISADRELSEELIETQGYAKRLEDEIAGQFTLGAFSKKNIVGQGCDISSYLPLEGSMNVS